MALPTPPTSLAAPPPSLEHGCHEAYRPIDPVGLGLGWFLVIATALAYLPQVLAFCSSRSSLGVSLLTPALALAYGTSNLCSTLILKWPSLKRCDDPAFAPFGAHGCVNQLLDALQQTVSAVGLAVVLLMTVTYAPHDTAKDRLVASGTIIGLLALVSASCILSGNRPCSAVSQAMAKACAYLSSFVVVVAFAPQLFETWRTKGRGSLSAVFYLIQSAGCCLVVYEQAIALHDSPVVWVPTAISGIMQGSILALLVWFRHCKSRPRTAASDGTRIDPLLVAQPVVEAEVAHAERMTPGFEDSHVPPQVLSTKLPIGATGRT